jgi:hypothetical protein
MEKTLEIDGKKVRFKSSGATPLRYKNQFHRDFLADIMKMQGLAKLGKKNVSYKELQELDTEVFYNICWALAKGADKDIPEPIEWLDEFDSFPLMEILPELQDLITSSIQSKKK